MEAVESSLWNEFVLPYVDGTGNVLPSERGPPSSEERSFLDLGRQDLEFWRSVVKHVNLHHAARAQRDDAWASSAAMSVSVFVNDLDRCFWRSLAVQTGLLPALGDEHLVANEHSDFDFLRSPYEVRDGAVIVRGTANDVDPSDATLPRCKYSALFDPRACFNSLRMAFLKYTGGDGLEALIFHLQAVDMSSALLQKHWTVLMDFVVDARGAFQQDGAVAGPPDRFLQDAWPLLRRAIVENRQYFLSYAELLLLAELKRQNVMVLGLRESGRADLLGAVTGHPDCSVSLVGLTFHEDHRRQRTHFERLVLASSYTLYMHMWKLQDEERAAMLREHVLMHWEDEAAQRFRDWVRQAEEARESAMLVAEDGTVQQSERSSLVRSDEDPTGQPSQLRCGAHVEDCRGQQSELRSLGQSVPDVRIAASPAGCSSFFETFGYGMQQESQHLSVGRSVDDSTGQPSELRSLGQSVADTRSAVSPAGCISFSEIFGYGLLGRPEDTSDTAAEAQQEAEGHGSIPVSVDVPDVSVGRSAQWLSVFDIQVAANSGRRFHAEILLLAAERIETLLRSSVTLPQALSQHPEAEGYLDRGCWLGRTCCGFKGCGWQASSRPVSDSEYRDLGPEHPWDEWLRRHVLLEHGPAMELTLAAAFPDTGFEAHMWDIYKEALAVQGRKQWPRVGCAIDRRAFAFTTAVYNDDRIRALICFGCARIHVDTGRFRSPIQFCSGRWLFSLPAGSLHLNFRFSAFAKRYVESKNPGTRQGAPFHGIGADDFADWTLSIHPEWERILVVDGVALGEDSLQVLRAMSASGDSLMCCPEDHHCVNGCQSSKRLCPKCRVPLCRECMFHLQRAECIPKGICNDNWWGYIQNWIFEQEVTWMEKTVSTPFWTGLTVFTIGQRRQERSNRPRHLMHDAMFSAPTRVAFKGQIFSAPLDWSSLLKQLEELEANEVRRVTGAGGVLPPDLPIVGQALAARVQVEVQGGLMSISNVLKQATVRRDIVVRLIMMFHDLGHPDYFGIRRETIEAKARKAWKQSAPTIPSEVQRFLDGQGDKADFDNVYEGVDKAATPAELMSSADRLEREMARSRPLLLLPQRDSDVNREVEASRLHAWSQVSKLTVQTGSKLIDQFETPYIPRVFHMSLPRCVGGPDFRGKPRHRRTHDDAAPLYLDSFTAMMASRVETQIRWDWDLLPGLWSLSFASKVNMSASLGFQRALTRGGADEQSDQKIGAATARIYKLLWDGEYFDDNGRRVKVRGDVSKMSRIIGLTKLEQALLRNYQYMSSTMSGTRQIRRRIGWTVFSSRVVYGCPVFMTVTPSERHSGLCIRLMRYRSNDPGLNAEWAAPFLPWIGENEPSICPPAEGVEVDLPEYDLRRLMTGKDALSCMHAFWTMIQIVLPNLYGWRMCPSCPDCVHSDQPCMDVFGSNATCMGGSLGRADAAIGAIEAQKAEGVLHLHLFVYLQMAHQFLTLAEIAALLREQLLTVDAMKRFVSTARCAAYPDQAKFEEERPEIEQAWPAYARDRTLSRPPAWAFDAAPPMLDTSAADSGSAWLQEGDAYTQQFNTRLQHTMSRMNHHIHPLVNDETGERRPLRSCTTSGKPKECRGNFPLSNEVTDEPLFVCPCVAAHHQLATRGSRSMLGSCLPRRTSMWLNAGPRAWSVFAGDNGDIKFPHKLPIIPETHERGELFAANRERCCQSVSELDLLYLLQASQGVAAGYFGGYSSKMQDIGHKETLRLGHALDRKFDAEATSGRSKDFNRYAKRLVKDLEAKGIIRTSLESLNLAWHADTKDVLRAECYRTFPTVSFPANQLLHREEVETGKKRSSSIIAAVYHGRADGLKSYTEWPFDLMYGFRGREHNVDLLSPFEMLRFWAVQKVDIPTLKQPSGTAELTAEGAAALKKWPTRRLHPGLHYVVSPAEGRLLLPDLACLGGLRHTWVWSKRTHPYVPVWSSAKIPKASLSPEENGRLLSVYMRPWTLNPHDASIQNLLLTDLADVKQDPPVTVQGPPVDTVEAPPLATVQDPPAATRAPLAATRSPSRIRRQRLADSEPTSQANSDSGRPKQRRAREIVSDVPSLARSYALAWQKYVAGGVVSFLSKRYITNLMAATAARVAEDPLGGDDETDDEPFHLPQGHAGSLALIEQTLRGIAASSSEDGEKGCGRYAQVVLLGRSLWASDPLTTAEKVGLQEVFFDDDAFPPLKDMEKAIRKATKDEAERPMPFLDTTKPETILCLQNARDAFQNWFDTLAREEERPNLEQMQVLHSVRDRILQELELDNATPYMKQFRRTRKQNDPNAEAYRGCIHGYPGTGKSRVILWLRRMFLEALKWEHGVQFVCVAFQNRVAYQMGGSTLHTAGEVPVGGVHQDRKLAHGDIDLLFTKNQALRWILIDEVYMIPDDLLGHFAAHFADAAVNSIYKIRADGTAQPFGGYNLIMFGDMLQLPPIPNTAALFLPPGRAKKSELANSMLHLFWGDDEDSINYFQELRQQMRVEDDWYDRFLRQCRYGALEDELYYFLMGLPTEHCGSWLSTMLPDTETSPGAACSQLPANPGYASCGNRACSELPSRWHELFRAGAAWEAMVALECDACKAERRRRNRLIKDKDTRVRRQPFGDAPYVHKNNDPKYHAMLLRAVEDAKRGGSEPRHILWVAAQDTPRNPRELGKNPDQKRLRWLQFNDQKTSGIPGLFPLFLGMHARVTEKIARGKDPNGEPIVILKHTPCTVCGWDLSSADRLNLDGCERLLQYIPKLIFLKFVNVKWRLHPDLDVGVFPLRPNTREWTLNASSGIKIARQGFTLVPDYASTAFMIQGTTLFAEIAECGDLFATPGLTEVLTAYVILSRVKRADALLLLRAFSPLLFTMGTPPGPATLLKLLRARFAPAGSGPAYTLEDAQTEYEQLASSWDSMKTLRKAKGLDWPCGGCAKRFPAEGFGAKMVDEGSVRTLCVAPGFWRMCLACSAARVVSLSAFGEQVEASRRCSECSVSRLEAYFVDRAVICSVCALQAEFEIFVCGHCATPSSMKKWSGRKDVAGTRLCLSCVPHAAFLGCSLCERQLPLEDFSFKYRDARHTFRRCNSCSVACSRCHRELKDARSFATASSLCWKCHKESRMYTCAACDVLHESKDFDADMLHNHSFHTQKLVCAACAANGYSPADVEAYACAGGHRCGHLAFSRQHLKDWKRRPRTAFLWCKECYKKKGQCEGCQKDYTREAFSEDMWHHHVSHRRRLVCEKCQASGISLLDCKWYTCDRCKQAFGHKFFDRNGLRNAKRADRNCSLLCTKCTPLAAAEREVEQKRIQAAREAVKALAAEERKRESRLLATLRLKDSHRCTCKTISKGSRAQAALYNNWHTEKCQLHRAAYGQRRWDGSNKGVTMDDLMFLKQRGSY